MRSIAPLLTGLSYAVARAAAFCVTVTTELVVPTTTYTFTSTAVITIHATTPKNLGTVTDLVRVSSTKTLATLTTTSTSCSTNGTITLGPISTVYTTSDASNNAAQTPTPHRYAIRGPGRRDDACTVTTTFTTTYGATETYLPASTTSTYTEYTAFYQVTVTSTIYAGTAYTIATATTTLSTLCGPTVTKTTGPTTTTTLDARCAPDAIVSAAGSTSNSPTKWGLASIEDTTNGGATFVASTPDASACCQLCAQTHGCATSAWDIRTRVCRVEFPTDSNTGEMNCGLGLLALYDYGPNHPMAPGTGWYIGTGCGDAEYAGAAPDDGS